MVVTATYIGPKFLGFESGETYQLSISLWPDFSCDGYFLIVQCPFYQPFKFSSLAAFLKYWNIPLHEMNIIKAWTLRDDRNEKIDSIFN